MATAFSRPTGYLAANGAIAIGSDSHITVSPAEDLRQLEYSQRLRDRARNVLAGGPGHSTGRRLYEAALAGGAVAMRSRSVPSRRAVAPIFACSMPIIPLLVGRSGDGVLDSWIFSGGNACVKDMFVAGHHVVADRHHIREDEIARLPQAVNCNKVRHAAHHR